MPNFDNTRKEPSVMPSSLPNLLLNGTLGIAVGMATNIPPHNLREVVDATVHLIDNPDATTEDLLQFIKGPDFPTAGIAYNQADISHAYANGRGGVVVDAAASCRASCASAVDRAGVSVGSRPGRCWCGGRGVPCGGIGRGGVGAARRADRCQGACPPLCA